MKNGKDPDSYLSSSLISPGPGPRGPNPPPPPPPGPGAPDAHLRAPPSLGPCAHPLTWSRWGRRGPPLATPQPRGGRWPRVPRVLPRAGLVCGRWPGNARCRGYLHSRALSPLEALVRPLTTPGARWAPSPCLSGWNPALPLDARVPGAPPVGGPSLQALRDCSHDSSGLVERPQVEESPWERVGWRRAR